MSGKNTVFLRKGKNMTQRVFDIENEKDMALLWSILPDEVYRIENRFEDYGEYYFEGFHGEGHIDADLILIDWHDKIEITRPIQECTEADVGKLCYFWNDDDNFYGKLDCILSGRGVRYSLGNGQAFRHCRRLTKQEIEELC